MDSEVIDKPDLRRFELAIPGCDEVAVAHYRVEGDRVILTHTEVPPAFSGRGIASRLARGAFDAIRASGRTLVPRCSFMSGDAARHPEYDDMIGA